MKIDRSKLADSLAIAAAALYLLDGLTLWMFADAYGPGWPAWELNTLIGAMTRSFGFAFAVIVTRVVYLAALVMLWPMVRTNPDRALMASLLMVAWFGFAAFNNIMSIFMLATL